MPRVYKRVPIEVRLEAGVDRSGGPDACHEWTKSRHDAGYGQISDPDIPGRPKRTHVLAWEIANGRKVLPGEKVRHTCDNPPCCNSRHLVIGSTGDNTRDMVERGRTTSPVTALDVQQIRERYHGHQGQLQQIANEYGISVTGVSNIVAGVTWAHLPQGDNTSTVGRKERVRLTEADVRNIRYFASIGATQKELAERFETTQTNISLIVRRKTWLDV